MGVAGVGTVSDLLTRGNTTPVVGYPQVVPNIYVTGHGGSRMMRFWIRQGLPCTDSAATCVTREFLFLASLECSFLHCGSHFSHCL